MQDPFRSVNHIRRRDSGGSKLTLVVALLSSAAANAQAAPAAPSPTADAIYWPAWILVGGVLIALAVMVGILQSIRTIMAAKPKPDLNHGQFTRMLCERVWAHTDTLTDTFAERMRQTPESLPTMLMMVRNLREDLSGPVTYVDYMKAYLAGSWPSPQLFSAFGAWAGSVRAMESQLADLFAQLSNPIAQEPVDKARETRLLNHYGNEQRVLLRSVDKIRAQAFQICDTAHAFLKTKKKPHEHGGEEEAPEHRPCPCCKRLPEKHVAPVIAADMTISPPISLAVPPPPSPTPAPAPAIPQPVHYLVVSCGCAIQRPCPVCAVSCTCHCTTVHAHSAPLAVVPSAPPPPKS